MRPRITLTEKQINSFWFHRKKSRINLERSQWRSPIGWTSVTCQSNRSSMFLLVYRRLMLLMFINIAVMIRFALHHSRCLPMCKFTCEFRLFLLSFQLILQWKKLGFWFLKVKRFWLIQFLCTCLSCFKMLFLKHLV